MKQHEAIGESEPKPCLLDGWWSSMKAARSTHLDMMRRYGRAPRGERVYVKQRRDYGQNVTLLAGLRLDGMTESVSLLPKLELSA